MNQSDVSTTTNQAGSDKPSSGKFQTGRVVVLSLCHFIHDAYSSFLAPLLPLLIEKLSMTLTQAGFLSTVMQIPALFNPLIGSLADRSSVRYFIILAPATTAIPMSLLGLAPNYGVLLVLLFCAGISVAMFHVPAPVMVSRLSATRVGRGMSFFMTGGESARTIGPLVAIGAVSLFGLEGAYPVMTVGILASIWLYLRFREVPVGDSHKRQTSLGETWRDMRYILVPLIAILVARGFMHAAMATFLPTYIKAETGNLWLAGLSLTLFEASGVVGVMTAGSLSDFFGRRKILAFSILGAPIGLFFFIGLSGWYRFMALMFTGFTLLSTTPVMLALVQENAIKSPAAANGFFMMSSFLARSAIVVIVGFAGDLMGLKATYLTSAALGFAGLPFLLLLPKQHRE
jgi:MFS transporter, FSR family, fosmidomycin resistance protein